MDPADDPLPVHLRVHQRIRPGRLDDIDMHEDLLRRHRTAALRMSHVGDAFGTQAENHGAIQMLMQAVRKEGQLQDCAGLTRVQDMPTC